MEDAIKNGNRNELTASVSAHEIDHATNPQNTRIAMRNANLNENADPEVTPEAAETKALKNAQDMRNAFKFIMSLLK